MAFTINRSCTPQAAKSTRENFLKQGMVEAGDEKSAQRIEAEGKMAFIDRTNNGADCFSEAEMKDFRQTPIKDFPAHQKRWGR